MKRFKLSYNSPAVLTFILISFIATFLGIKSNDSITYLLFSTYHSSLLDPLTYLRFFTHVFGHIGWEHFLGNAAYLLLLGPMLEEKYGSKAIVEVMALTAIITGLINYIFFPNVMLCGASGIAFAFILMASFTGFRNGEIPLTFILVAVIYLGQQIYDGLFVQDNISNMAHIVGGLLGAITAYKINRK